MSNRIFIHWFSHHRIGLFIIIRKKNLFLLFFYSRLSHDTMMTIIFTICAARKINRSLFLHWKFSLSFSVCIRSLWYCCCWECMHVGWSRGGNLKIIWNNLLFLRELRDFCENWETNFKRIESKFKKIESNLKKN